MGLDANLAKLVDDIDASIEAVRGIPKISTESFSSDHLKTEVIPILEVCKQRVTNIEGLTQNIDGIRDEIIRPVNRIIKASARINTWLSVFGFLVGIVGIILTISSYLAVHQYDGLVASYQESMQMVGETNQILGREVELLSSLNDLKLESVIPTLDDSEAERIAGLLEDRQEQVRARRFIQKLYVPGPNHLAWYWWALKWLMIVVTLLFLWGGGVLVLDDQLGAAFLMLLLAIGIQVVSFLFV